MGSEYNFESDKTLERTTLDTIKLPGSDNVYIHVSLSNEDALRSLSFICDEMGVSRDKLANAKINISFRNEVMKEREMEGNRDILTDIWNTFSDNSVGGCVIREQDGSILLNVDIKKNTKYKSSL